MLHILETDFGIIGLGRMLQAARDTVLFVAAELYLSEPTLKF